jgi:hypothetical protein
MFSLALSKNENKNRTILFSGLSKGGRKRRRRRRRATKSSNERIEKASKGGTRTQRKRMLPTCSPPSPMFPSPSPPFSPHQLPSPPPPALALVLVVNPLGGDERARRHPTTRHSRALVSHRHQSRHSLAFFVSTPSFVSSQRRGRRKARARCFSCSRNLRRKKETF